MRILGAGPRDIARVVLTVAAAIATVGVVGRMLWYSRYGLDLTDEGYYLNWISSPGQYEASATLFGFVYHPLYVLVGGDILLMRQANILIMFGLGWLAAYLAFTRVLAQPRTSVTVITAAAAGGCSTMLGFHVNLVTPSYNSLVLCGIMVVIIGLLIDPPDAAAGDDDGPVRTVGLRRAWILVGVGGVLIFCGKPTAAVSVGVVVCVYALVSGRWRSTRLLWAGGTGLVSLLALAVVIDRNPWDFVMRLWVGAERLAVLGAGHDSAEVMRWDSLAVEGPFRQAMVGAIVIMALAGIAFGFRARIGGFIAGVAAVIAAVWWFRMTEQEYQVFSDRDLNPRSMMITGPLAAVIVVAALAGRERLRSVSRAQWALAGTLLILPHASAIGSNLHYWQQAGMAAISWTVAAIVVFVPFKTRYWVPAAVLPITLMGQVMTYAFLHPTFEWPYRQAQPMFEFTERASVGPADRSLYMTDDAAPFIRETKEVFSDLGLDDGHPVIDLTGQSPGVIWVGGALAVDHPWVIGGYSGSDDHERAALAELPCEQVAESWVLWEEDGPRTISRLTLEVFGAEWHEDYRVAAEWDAPQIGRRPWDVDRGTLQLWEPTRSAAEAVAACESMQEDDQ